MVFLCVLDFGILPAHNQTATRSLSHWHTHTDTRMHSHTRLLYILSPYLIHFFPPKHSLSFRCFQIGTLNGSLSLSSFYRNWCYTSNKAHHDFITVSLCFFKQIAPSKLIFFPINSKKIFLPSLCNSSITLIPIYLAWM